MKFFDTILTVGAVFNVVLRPQTPTALASRSFLLGQRLPSGRNPLFVWVGFGNGSKPAGSATPSADPREAVPASDPTRSGKAFRDGWQPVGIVDRDRRRVRLIARTVEDWAHVAHLGAEFESQGYCVTGIQPVISHGGRMVSTTLAHNGAPRSSTFRNTEANTATHRDRAAANFAALMEHGRRLQGD